MENLNQELWNQIQEQYHKLLKESGVVLDEDYQKEIMDSLGMTSEELNQLGDETIKSMSSKKIKVRKVHPDAVLPEYAYPTDSGFDLYSTEEHTLPPFGRALVPTGICVEFDENLEIQVRPKSGLALNKGLTVLNTPGTVDCFSEDMKILTIEGEKLISEIKIGDIVFSFNESTFEIEKDTITHIFNTEEQDILQIETEYGILEVTPNSEVYTKKGIVLAKNLTETDEILVFF